MGHLAEIQSIAGANGGHRAFGYSGYDASLEYVRSKVDHFSNRSTSWTQNFIALFNRVDSVSFEANGVSYFVHGLGYSPSTSIEGISAELVLGPTGDAGCTPEGYKDFDIKNKIVLVERGKSSKMMICLKTLINSISIKEELCLRCPSSIQVSVLQVELWQDD